MPWLQIIVALVLAGAGAAVGGLAVHRIDVRQVERLSRDLAAARSAAIGERAAREAVTQQCAANEAATSLGRSLQDTAQRAIERATQELDNAQGDDSDPLRAQFERLRGGGDAGAAGGGAGQAPGGADGVSRR
jgi:biopolymer transport protein ExbB/TolQ